MQENCGGIKNKVEPVGKRQVPAEFKRLRGMVNITDAEIAKDEHLAHIIER